ncbi:MAG: hypothetical protein RR202_10475 [Bacteroidales bacterium]
MDLNKLKQEIHQNAIEKGFWEHELSDEHCLMLVITEIAEMVEADRKGMHVPLDAIKIAKKQGFNDMFFKAVYSGTVEDELADIVIRLLDLAGARDIEIEDFIKRDEEGLKEARKRIPPLTCISFALCQIITSQFFPRTADRINDAISFVDDYCQIEGIDLWYFVGQKMLYNRTRQALHGKKY